MPSIAAIKQEQEIDLKVIVLVLYIVAVAEKLACLADVFCFETA